MNAQVSVSLLSLGAAWLAGSLIGLERTFHGRVAGFRTHGIVALAAALVVMVARAPLFTTGALNGAAPNFDPSRIAQGVMTGVGFLGGGVIFKEGVNVQGLTSAASIWATAAIGLTLGLGLYEIGTFATVAVLISLSVFRWMEYVMPTRTHAMGTFRFNAQAAPDEAGLRRLLNDFVTVAHVSQRLTDGGRVF